MTPLLRDEGQLPPDRVSKCGWHIDKYWPGLVHSIWSFKFIKIKRERKYHERTHDTLKLESWMIICRVGRHRFGVKWERDL